MARHYFSEINLHIVWHTKSSLPQLSASIEIQVYEYNNQKIVNMPGAFVHAVGGTENHVHLAIAVPPTLLISEFIGRLRGGGSHDINHRHGEARTRLEWQGGYGVVGFGKKDLP